MRLMRCFATFAFVFVVGLGATYSQSSGLPGREAGAEEAALIVGGGCGSYTDTFCTGTCSGSSVATGVNSGFTATGGCSSPNCGSVKFSADSCG